MPIEFKCSSCQVTIRVPDVYAGKKAHCPKCNARVKIPAAGAANSTEIEKVKDAPAASNEIPTATAVYPETQADRLALQPADDGAPPTYAAPAANNSAGGGRPATAPLVLALVGGFAVVLVFVAGFLLGRMSAPVNTVVIQSPAPPPALAQGAAPVRVAEAAPPPVPQTESKAVQAQTAQPASQAARNTDPGESRGELQAKFQPAAHSETPRSRNSMHDSADTQDDSRVATPFATPPVAVPPAPPPSVDSMISSKEKRTGDVEDDTDNAPAKFNTKAPVAPAPQPDKDAQAAPDAPAAKAVATKPVAPAPAPVVCAACLGTGFVPNMALRPYVRMGSEKITPATGANAVPWRYCPKCSANKDGQALISAESARIDAAVDEHKKWEEVAGHKLAYAETHHVTIRSTLDESEAKIVATALEQLTTQLEQSTLSTVLTQTRPDTDLVLIGGDKPGYTLFLSVLQQMHPTTDFALAKDSTGFMISHMAVYNGQKNSGMYARNMGLYQFGEMLITQATDNKAPAWLRLGFASYCENLITKQNLCYAFQYEKNDVHFGENWDQEVKKYASQSKLKTWDQIFPLMPIGMSALDYLTCYSMVEFLMITEPKLFPKLCVAFRDGLDSEKAIQKVYNTDYKRVQMLWATWAVSK